MGNETISASKTVDTEQFPVASVFLEAKNRQVVLDFYEFARTADDIADSPTLSQIEKLTRLETLEEVLDGKTEAAPFSRCAANLRQSLRQRGISNSHAKDLLKAFRMDALEVAYFRWWQLLGYCRLSAAPVGRFLLDLHEETSPKAQNASDALCAALQITNHLQDAKKDLEGLGRIYLPKTWFSEMGVPIDTLKGQQAVGQVRLLFDRGLDGVDHLVKQAAPLPLHIRDFRLRIQAGVSIACAARLSRKLRRMDPLASPVKLNKLDFLLCGLTGLFRGIFKV